MKVWVIEKWDDDAHAYLFEGVAASEEAAKGKFPLVQWVVDRHGRVVGEGTGLFGNGFSRSVYYQISEYEVTS